MIWWILCKLKYFFLFLCYRNVNKGVNFATLLGIIIFRKGFNFMLMTVLQNIIQELWECLAILYSCVFSHSLTNNLPAALVVNYPHYLNTSLLIGQICKLLIGCWSSSDFTLTSFLDEMNLAIFIFLSLVWSISSLPLAECGAYFTNKVPLRKECEVTLNHVSRSNVKVIIKWYKKLL